MKFMDSQWRADFRRCFWPPSRRHLTAAIGGLLIGVLGMALILWLVGARLGG